MKIVAITMLLGIAVSIASADGPVCVWGTTAIDNPSNYVAGVNVRAESYQGNTNTVQSYETGDVAQYDIYPSDGLEIGRTYYRVHAWTSKAEGEANGFYWDNTQTIRRDVLLNTTAK